MQATCWQRTLGCSSPSPCLVLVAQAKVVQFLLSWKCLFQWWGYSYASLIFSMNMQPGQTGWHTNALEDRCTHPGIYMGGREGGRYLNSHHCARRYGASCCFHWRCTGMSQLASNFYCRKWQISCRSCATVASPMWKFWMSCVMPNSMRHLCMGIGIEPFAHMQMTKFMCQFVRWILPLKTPNIMGPSCSGLLKPSLLCFVSVIWQTSFFSNSLVQSNNED